MSQHKPIRPASTPVGHFGEVKLHAVLGYQMAQAAISTLSVFDHLVGRDMELRPVEFTILALIAENPGVAPAKLAQVLAVSAPNITTWIDRLESRGMVTRERSEIDKRGQLLRVTALGETRASDATGRLTTGERAAFNVLTDGEWAILIELLQKVAAARPKRARVAQRGSN